MANEPLSTGGAAQVIVDTALRSAEPAELTRGKIYAVHTSAGVTQIDLTGPQYMDEPSRKVGTTTVRDAISFGAYFEKHADANSEVYANADALTITAVLDAHTPDAARWEAHNLRLQLRLTDAWRAWVSNDGELLPQADFAEFLEDRLPDILEPSAAEMLEIAQSIQASTKAEFKSGTRLSSGERQFQFVETVTAKAGQKGQLTIPERFTIGLVPFEGAEGYKLGARLR
jgi:uncharacterized protein YfdQ (DUF2303 family)